MFKETDVENYVKIGGKKQLGKIFIVDDTIYNKQYTRV